MGIDARGAHQRVDVGGYRLAYEFAGTGSPVVVLESGIGGTIDTWDHIFTPVAHFARVVRYDRAGLGGSDPAPTPRSCYSAVADLHQMLARLALPPPYVLVGHSFGGMLSRLFALCHPAAVSGLVLLDAAHPDAMRRYLECLPAPVEHEPPALAAARSYLGGGYADPALNPEGLCLSDLPPQASARDALGDRPLVVLTASRYELPPGLPSTLATPLQDAWLGMQREIAALSRQSTHRIAEHSGHHIQKEQPDLVIDAVHSVVQASRTAG